MIISKGGHKDTMEYKRRIRELRKEKGLTYEDLGRILNTTKQCYSRYETQDTALPIERLIILANFYNVTTDYILGLSDKKSRG